MKKNQASDAVAKLRDKSQWVVKEGVPVFCEHDECDADGKVVKHWGRDELEVIASNAREAFEKRGHAPRITIGHTLRGPNVKEKEQPPLVGFQMEPRVGEFGPEGQLGILCDFYYYPDKADEAKEYPYRSVELYPGTKELAGCALLKRDPKLQMGMVCYERSGDLARYSMDQELDVANTSHDDPMMDKMMRALHDHPAFKHMVRRYMDETGDCSMGGMSKYMGTDPNPEESPMPTPTPATPDPGQLQSQYDNLKAELAEERKQRTALEARLREEGRKGELMQLSRDGYKFDANDLLTQVKDLPQDQYERQVTFIKKYVPCEPAEQGILRTVEDTVEKPMTKDDMQACRQYHKEHPDLTWESAVVKYKGGK